MRNLAIITARSGSKGLPHKNIKLLCGIPLLAYSIIAAKESGCYDKIVVSTDSEEYAKIAREWGAEVPFFRSEENSSDTANSWDTCREVIRSYEAIGEKFDTFTILQPTSPLRTADDIKNGFALMKEKNADAVVAVTPTVSPKFLNTLPESLSLDGFIQKQDNTRRQVVNKTQYYKLNGALYIVKTNSLPENNFIYNDKAYAYIMPEERSIDIDTELDFVMVEAVINHNKTKKD